MKENKFFGHFTNENIQQAFRNPSKATFLEAGFSMLCMGLVGIGADIVYDNALKPLIENGKEAVVKVYNNFKKKK